MAHRKTEGSQESSLESSFRSALKQRGHFRQMWNTVWSNERMKQPRMQSKLNSALFNAIESLQDLSDDTVANLETVLDSSNVGFNVQLQIIGKFLKLRIRPTRDLLKRIDRCNFEEIIKPEYLSVFAEFVGSL